MFRNKNIVLHIVFVLQNLLTQAQHFKLLRGVAFAQQIYMNISITLLLHYLFSVTGLTRKEQIQKSKFCCMVKVRLQCRKKQQPNEIVLFLKIQYSRTDDFKMEFFITLTCINYGAASILFLLIVHVCGFTLEFLAFCA